MIRVNLSGQLGNQMFEYAYARAISEECGDRKIRFNDWFSFFLNVSTKKYKRDKIGLWAFRLNPNVKRISHGFFRGFLDFLQYLYCYIRWKGNMPQNKFLEMSAKGKLVIPSMPFTFYRHAETEKKNKVVTGYFQNEKYFENIRDVLLEEFSVKTEPDRNNSIYLKEIDSCNSVCMHIRRGDYLSKKWDYLNVCNVAYYQRAMDYISQRIKQPVFYVFSNNADEIEWIRQNYKLGEQNGLTVKYVDLNNAAYEDMRLMYHCKHFIISNSSFSWWGSYLSRYDNKIVIAPAIWQKKPYNGLIDVYRKEMIKMDFPLD